MAQFDITPYKLEFDDESDDDEVIVYQPKVNTEITVDEADDEASETDEDDDLDYEAEEENVIVPADNDSEETVSTATAVEPAEALPILMDVNDQRIADDCGSEWALEWRRNQAMEEAAEDELHDGRWQDAELGEKVMVKKLNLLKLLRRANNISEEVWQIRSNMLLDMLMKI